MAPTAQEESKIYSTKDYHKFTELAGNRPVSEWHIKHLTQSFDKNPELSKTRPILVNDNFEIIDGQHRYRACLTLGLPIYYMMVEGTDLDTARYLNADQKSWRLVDFLNSYAATGHEQYVKLQALREEYPIPLSQLVWFAAGHSAKNLTRSFRTGEFRFMKDKDYMYKRLNALRDVGIHFKYWTSNRFISAFWIVWQVNEFDPERFQQKLKYAEMQPQASARDYLREIERVYNFKVADTDRVRLF